MLREVPRSRRRERAAPLQRMAVAMTFDSVMWLAVGIFIGIVISNVALLLQPLNDQEEA